MPSRTKWIATPWITAALVGACASPDGTPERASNGGLPSATPAVSEGASAARAGDPPPSEGMAASAGRESLPGTIVLAPAVDGGGESGRVSPAPVPADGGARPGAPTDGGTPPTSDAVPEAPVTVAATPPMGWNSWNTFGCNVSEALIRSMADTLVSSGMQAAGYRYVNIDDCWMNGRDAAGKLRWSNNFPAGIPALADYIHGLGLLIGIYEVPADRTCANRYGGYTPGAGSLGHEVDDANSFAEWGIDYLKYDLCVGQRGGFVTMRDALRATGRPILYSINPGNGQNDLCPPNRCTLDLPSIANIWRIGYDIDTTWQSWLRLIDENAELYSYAGPGHFNDPDMLEVGRGATEAEDRAHFSLWAIMAAPLLAGNDLRNMSATTRTILTNGEVIAVDQDALGVQGRVVATPAPGLQVWSKPLSGTNARAVVLFNRTGAAASISVPWSALGLPANPATVRDLWSHTGLGTFEGSYSAPSVPSHGVVMLKIQSVL